MDKAKSCDCSQTQSVLLIGKDSLQHILSRGVRS